MGTPSELDDRIARQTQPPEDLPPDDVGQALIQALQASGIGGKTRLGYGRFEGKGRSDKVTR
jgi:hypothetical protein